MVVGEHVTLAVHDDPEPPPRPARTCTTLGRTWLAAASVEPAEARPLAGARSWITVGPTVGAPRSRATTTPAPDAPPARMAAASTVARCGRDRLHTGGEAAGAVGSGGVTGTGPGVSWGAAHPIWGPAGVPNPCQASWVSFMSSSLFQLRSAGRTSGGTGRRPRRRPAAREQRGTA